MKVVFLSQRVPWPPDRGDRITTWHFLSHLLARGATVRAGCLAEDARDREAAATLVRRGVAEVCAPSIDRRRRKLSSLRGLVTGEALTMPFFRHRALARTVARWLRDDPPDVVWVYSSSMAQYALPHPGPLRLMQFAELDSDKWRQMAARGGRLGRWIYGREARLLLELERRVARAFDLSCVVSEVEKELFLRCIPEVTPVVLRNGVDTEHFTSRGEQAREPHTVIFTGVMDYEPNIDGVLGFAAECWPAVRRQVPDARFLVVGSKPAAPIVALHGKHGIEVTGRVPETPPWFDRAAVAVAPLRLARGVQNKVLEAMSMGLPVVASPQAAQGIGAVGADTLTVAEGATATAAAVCGLLREPDAARAMGRRAAAWVRAHFRWEAMYAEADRLLEEGLAGKRAAKAT